MNKAQTTTIRTLLITNYTDILIKARKAQKGLRMQYISTIMLVGEYSDGLRCIEAAMITGKTIHNTYQKLFRACRAGYVRKENKRYYLTDTGMRVYSSVCVEFDTAMNEILKVLIEEARSRL